MIRVPVTNEEEAAAALDAMGATPEKKAAFLEALPGLKENAEKMGGGTVIVMKDANYGIRAVVNFCRD